MLVVAVTGLSTIAKEAQYFSRMSPIRTVSVSTKMEVTPAPVTFAEDPLRPICHIVRPQPRIQTARVEETTIAPPPRIALALSMQHRSPPESLS